jgi:hypothetical protein
VFASAFLWFRDGDDLIALHEQPSSRACPNSKSALKNDGNRLAC